MKIALKDLANMFNMKNLILQTNSQSAFLLQPISQNGRRETVLICRFCWLLSWSE